MIIYLAGHIQEMDKMRDPGIYKHVLFCFEDGQCMKNFKRSVSEKRKEQKPKRNKAKK